VLQSTGGQGTLAILILMPHGEKEETGEINLVIYFIYSLHPK
jgi:hypothetical protein